MGLPFSSTQIVRVTSTVVQTVSVATSVLMLLASKGAAETRKASAEAAIIALFMIPIVDV